MGVLQIKRVYDAIDACDGKRILVDKLWPRGIKKEALHMDYWAKDMTPSTQIRETFNHEPEQFNWFQDAYLTELNLNPDTNSFVTQISSWLKTGNVTLLYAAKNPICNHAIILKKFLEQKLANLTPN